MKFFKIKKIAISSPISDVFSETISDYDNSYPSTSNSLTRSNSISSEEGLFKTLENLEVPLEDILELINRSKETFYTKYYIYDVEKFNRSFVRCTKFDILESQCLPIYCKYVGDSLIQQMELRATKESDLDTCTIFTPTINEIDSSFFVQTNKIIQKLFPRDGCSLRGKKLDELIGNLPTDLLVATFRKVFSLLHGGLISIEEHKKLFGPNEQFQFIHANVALRHLDFYKDVPRVLNSEKNSYLLARFLRLVLVSWYACGKHDEESLRTFLNIAASICIKTKSKATKGDIHKLVEFYNFRNSAFTKLFWLFLKSSSECEYEEAKRCCNTSLHSMYSKSFVSKRFEQALVITIEQSATSFSDILKRIGSSKSTKYRENEVWFFDEIRFVENICKDPHKTVKSNTTKLSLDYFDKLDALYWGQWENSDQHSTNPQSIDCIKVSILQISEWLLHVWKKETSDGVIRNSFVFELSRPIGRFDWLVIVADGTKDLRKNLGSVSSAPIYIVEEIEEASCTDHVLETTQSQNTTLQRKRKFSELTINSYKAIV